MPRRLALPVRHRSTRARGAALAGALVLSGGSLAGCSLVGGDEDADADGPDALAADLATALAQHRLDDVELTRPEDAAAHAELVAPLDELPVSVTAGEVTETPGADDAPDTAEVRLTWEWQLSEEARWTYDTTALLEDAGETWRVDWAPDVLVPELVEGDTLGLRTVPARRGDITGAGGLALVTDRPVLRYGLDKTRVPAARVGRNARLIARALDLDAAAYVEQAEAAGPEAFVEAVVLRTEDARDVPPAYADIPGAVALDDTLPLAPTREFAAPLLGRVGPATAEIVAESDGRVQAGDEVGLSGLQARYDETLAGRPGVAVVARGADEQLRTLHEVPATDGTPLATTLDPELQLAAEAALAGLGEGAPASALVAVRPSDGAVLAAANGAGTGGAEIAASGRYAPGSTFKVVTALALLRAGVGVGDVVSCPPTITVDGRSFKNYDDYPASSLGQVTLTEAIAQSCNTALIGSRDRFAPADLTAAAAALGLGVDHDLGFPAYFGQVPPPETETGAAADVIGQGTVLASPLAMATVAASVAAGRAVLPTLLPDHAVTQTPPERPLTPGEAGALRGLMRAVVTQGSGRFLLDVPGEVGAKTGTAQYGTADAGGELPTHAWMIATRGDLAVAVFVETGASGSVTAGPVLEAFLR